MSKAKEATRKTFRDVCFKRDKYACVMCGKKAISVESAASELNVHHIMNRKLFQDGGYVKENGITLCDISPDSETQSCHQKAESWWADSALVTGGTPGFDPDTLYAKINSSFQKALKR